MKKDLIKWLFLIVIFFSVSSPVSAQIYVKIRPAAPVIVRTAQPSRDHVWIDEEWEPNGNSYKYSGGHWEAPPHPGYAWRPGHWRHYGRRGEIWVHGGWRRR
jgi:WXXGXW repeat (2 copies)